MSETNDIRLTIRSPTIPSSDLAQMVPLDWDETWEPGDVRTPTIVVYKDHGCMKKTQAPETAPRDDHIHQMMSWIRPLSDQFRSLPADCSVVFRCCILADRPRALYFERELLALLSRIGADLDVDLMLIEE